LETNFKRFYAKNAKKLEKHKKLQRDELSARRAQEMSLRREHLLRQRDKLVKMKQAARQRQFEESNSKAERSAGASRPKTAQLARSALRGQIQPAADASSSANRPSEQIIAARRELVKKLKHEVMGL